MKEQEKIRKLVKIAKALNDDIYYKDFADYIGISEHGFYNWLNGYYKLSKDKLCKLEDIVVELAEDNIS